MKTLAILAVLSLPALCSLALQDPFEGDPPQESHAWLQQLVGEWKMTAEGSMGEGTEPMTMESTESVRALGELWIMAEGEADFGGQPFATVMTLGYDSRKEAFVGTWIDSMHTHMWSYEGKLDAAKKVLTLETEGPAFDDPARIAKYRDVIEIESADRRSLSSSVLGDDGKWTTFMRAQYERVK